MKNYRNLNQKGLVAIVSTILIIIIIAVITLSLSVYSRRELRQALDEQLSSQALYAAESGVNEVVNKIKSNSLNEDISDCSPETQNKISLNRTLQADSNVRYTCILVDQSPDTINTDVSTSNSKLYIIDPGPSETVSTLSFTWKNTNSSIPTIINCSTPPNCFLPAGSWGSRLGVLRVRLFPAPSIGLPSSTFDDSSAIDITGFPGGPVSNNLNVSLTRSKYLYANCDSASCTVTISNLSSTGAKKYYLQISSLYKDINVTVAGTNSSSLATEFNGAQAKIDATGAAGDVYKRLLVTVPLGESSELPVYSLGVGDRLCKRFETSGSGTSDASAGTCSAF